jgi:hypothetical protein
MEETIMSMQGGQSGQGKEMGSESMRTPSMNPSQITMYLRNMDFPADKKKIMDMAKSNGAPEMVVQWINKLPDKQYSSSNDVEREFGKMK